MKSLLQENKKYLLLLTLMYVCSQGLILIVSGLWYDDWCIIGISTDGLKMWASAMGRPDFFFIVKAMQVLPDVFYKIVIFGGYYIISISYYLIIEKCFGFEKKEALTVTTIMLCIYMNDIRIERLGLPYTIGLTLFSVAFCLLVHSYSHMNKGRRIIILTLFFFSYILNSLLVFMGIVWLYIIMREKDIKNIIKKVDFFVLPIIFFLLKNTIFPSHGVYSDYNQVELDKMYMAFPVTVQQFGRLVQTEIDVYMNTIKEYPVLVFSGVVIISLACGLLYFKGNNRQACKIEEENVHIKSIMAEFMMGGIMVFGGLYPYVVVGNGIDIDGFDSRNTILVPFGMAILVHAVFTLVVKRRFINVIIIFMIVISTLLYAKGYARYQCIYYSDKGLQIQLENNPHLGELKRVGIVENDYASFYAYNGMFEEVYGNESRFVNNIKFESAKESTSWCMDCKDYEWYNVREYDCNYDKIDCVILYENTLTPMQALWIRFREILGADIHKNLNKYIKFRVIYPNESEFTNYIL